LNAVLNPDGIRGAVRSAFRAAKGVVARAIAARSAFLTRSRRSGSTRMIEVYRCTARILTRLHARVKAGVPPEMLDVDLAAGAARNRADLHIAVIDVPAVLALGIAAAGEMRPGP
jgi:hypothetical protein